MPDTDKANSFHGQTSWVRFNDCVPDFQYAMELWALRPPRILAKVISVCRIHVFFHQYVLDLREEKSENVLRTFATSPVIFDMAVCSTSGVIATPPESSAGAVLPLNTGINIWHCVNSGSPFVIPPELGIERPVMQPQDLQTDRTSESRPPLSLLSLSAASPALTLTRMPAQFSSSSSSIQKNIASAGGGAGFGGSKHCRTA